MPSPPAGPAEHRFVVTTGGVVEDATVRARLLTAALVPLQRSSTDLVVHGRPMQDADRVLLNEADGRGPQVPEQDRPPRGKHRGSPAPAPRNRGRAVPTARPVPAPQLSRRTDRDAPRERLHQRWRLAGDIALLLLALGVAVLAVLALRA